MFLGWKNLILVRRWLLLSLLVISCSTVGFIRVLNQIGTELSNDTVLTSSRTMVANWSSSFRPHGTYLDELKFTLYNYTEFPQAMLALQNGELDAYDEQVPLDFFVALVNDENIDVRVSDSVSYQTLILNCDRFPTNITAFRRAMAFGMDKYRIDVQGNLGYPQDSYIPRIATKWEVESQLNEYFYEADFIAGNASLENAGFIDLDDDGWREYDKNHNGIWDAGIDLDDEDPSFVIDLAATAGCDREIIVCEIMQYGLEAMGIHSNLIEKNDTTLLTDAFAGDFWAFCFNMEVDITNPPTILYSKFRTGQYFCDKILRFRNSTIDAALDDMMTVTTQEEVKEKISEATTLLVFEQPAIVCFNRFNINAFRTDRFSGFFDFKGYGYTGRNPYFGTKIHLKDSKGGLGGTFKMSKFGDLETTNIFMVSEGSTNMVMRYIYEKLWQVDPLTWDPIPGLAYDWKIESTAANGDILDGQKFTFYLYENETWHDGIPFTAADINHSMNILRANQNHGSKMRNFYKIEIPNDHTIELYLNKSGYLEWADTTSFYITPEHIWREIANVSTYSPTIAEVIGTGPFKLNTWVTGESITLLRHINWRWDIWDVSLFQPFTILSPVRGGNYFGQVVIQWAPIEDSFDHNITYTLAYSPDNGTTWVTIATDLNSTSYIWDSVTVTNGDLYLIQINASCNEDTWQVAISNSTFTIDNKSPITTDYPSNQIFNSSNQSDTPFNLVSILQIFGSITIISFVITLVIIIRKQRIS